MDKERTTDRTWGSTERRVILAFAVTALIGAALVTLSLRHILHRILLERAETHLRARARVLAAQLEDELTEAQRNLVLLADMPTFRQLPNVDQVDPAIHGVPKDVEVEKRRILAALMSRTQTFSALYILQPDGRIYLAHPYGVQAALDRSSLAERPYYREAVRTKAPVISDVIDGADGIRAVVVLVPVLGDRDDVVAYLGGVLYLTRLSRQLSAEAAHPFDAAFILDRKGRLAGHSDPNMLADGAREHFAATSPAAGLHTDEHAAQAHPGDHLHLSDWLDPADGKRYMVELIHLGTDWHLGLMRDREAILAEARPAVRQTTGIVFILLLVVGVIGVAAAHRTGRRWGAAELALRASEDHLRLIWEHIETGAMLVDCDTRTILDVNPTALTMIGADRDAVVGARCTEILCPAARGSCPVLDLGQRVDRSECELVRADGRRLSVVKSVTPFRLGDRNVLLESFVDVTKLKQVEERQALHARVLAVLNRPDEWEQLVRDLLVQVKEFTGFDAVGIRLRDEEDFPYYVANGFDEEFVRLENHLACVVDGTILRDEHGRPVLECTCGLVLSGNPPEDSPLFTANGSFWSNDTTPLLDLSPEQDPRHEPRNRCIHQGYKSVALIPLKSGREIIGLLQLNDRRSDRFTLETIGFFEEIGNSIGIAYTRVRAQTALAASEERYRVLADNADDFVVVNHVDGRRLYVSPSYYRVTGWTPEELQSGDWRERIHPDDLPMVEETRAANLAGETTRIEYRILCKNGTWLWVDSCCKPIAGADGRVERMLLWSRDVSVRIRLQEEKEQMQAQLLQAQKLESMGTLAGGVAHEINNPIMGIMNYAQLIKDGLDGEEETPAELAAEIIHETERVATLTKNLLQFARNEKQAHSPARVGDIVAATLSLIRTVMLHDQTTLEVDVPEDLPEIKCRSQQIQQVLMNLLTNARDALNEKYDGYHEDKIVRLSARVLEPASGDIGPPESAAGDIGPPESAAGDIGPPESIPARPRIRLTVEDHGAGIPDDVRERMFDPFYTTKKPDRGTGLGLAISYGIVRDHHGELSVESEPGQWTRFHVDLPVNNGWTLEPTGEEA